MPGNLVRLDMRPRVEDPELLTMATRQGQPIPARLRDIGGFRVFAPDAPIAEGTEVVVEYSLVCTPHRRSPGPTPIESFTFTAGRHEEREYELGAISITERGIRRPGIPDSEVSFVRVQLPVYLIEGNADYSDLVRHAVTLDGARHPFDMPRLGEGGVDAEVVVTSWCTGPDETAYDSCGAISNVPTGRHTLEVTTSILGEETPLGVSSIEVDTTCSYTAASAIEEDAGCALSPRPTRGSALPLVGSLLALVSAWALRKRG